MKTSYYRTPETWGETAIIPETEIDDAIESMRNIGDDWDDCSIDDVTICDNVILGIVVFCDTIKTGAHLFINTRSFYTIDGEFLGTRVI